MLMLIQKASSSNANQPPLIQLFLHTSDKDIARIAAAEVAAATAGGAAAAAEARALIYSNKAITSKASSPPSQALGRAAGCSSNGGAEAKGEGERVARSGKRVRWNKIADDESFLVEVCEFDKDDLVTSVKRNMARCLWTTDGMLVIHFFYTTYPFFD